MPDPPHSIHSRLMRWCGHTSDPPHSLHLLLRFLCGQISDPPQSLHRLFRRPCLHKSEPPHSLHLLLLRPCSQRVAFLTRLRVCFFSSLGFFTAFSWAATAAAGSTRFCFLAAWPASFGAGAAGAAAGAAGDSVAGGAGGGGNVGGGGGAATAGAVAAAGFSGALRLSPRGRSGIAGLNRSPFPRLWNLRGSSGLVPNYWVPNYWVASPFGTKTGVNHSTRSATLY
jgi:hypothetical protein